MNEWISVEDRLPDQGLEVLCLDSSQGDVFNAAHFRQTGWRRDAKYVYVTHWMPLPEPPK